jgi:AcrR family transcriptional regulator
VPSPPDADPDRTRPPSPRSRAREQLTRDILATARAHLATDGAAGLSLRAVARELGMVSSAVYRYVPSRDDLLTRLIVEAYDALGAAAEAAEAPVPRDQPADRFRAVAQSVRRWALAHEHEYALLYGSPVPGYRAPQTTIPPASRVPQLLIAIIQDAVAAGRLPADLPPPPRDVLAAIAPVQASFDAPGHAVPPELVVRGLMAWTYLFGAVSFDLFGHRHNVLADERRLDSPFFATEVERLVALVGLDAASAPSRPEPDVARATSRERPATTAPVTVVEGRVWQ